MAIVSKPLSGRISLTGNDATAFRQQIANPDSVQQARAQDMMRRASSLRINEDGSVTLRARTLRQS